jgi:uncharacterized membrane protein YcaP (DUF421 family)
MDIFGTSSSSGLLDMGVRLAVTYALLLVVARLIGRRTARPANRDMIVAAMLGGLVAPALIRPEDAPAVALAGIAILFAADLVVARLAFLRPQFSQALYGQHTPLISDGNLIQMALLREGISFAEINSIVRSEGLKLEEVEHAFLEPEGEVTVVSKAEARGIAEPRLSDVLSALERIERRLEAG